MVNERERPDAGEEWIAKAALLGATDMGVEFSVWGRLWVVSGPDNKPYYGVTQARACRKLVRAIAGDEDGQS